MRPNNADKHFVFVHRELQFAVPVREVVEIVEAPLLLPFHGSMPGCLGNVTHRDHLLSVLDPTALGTARDLPPQSSRTFIVIRSGEVLFGLAMDRFVAVVVVPPDSAGAWPVEGRSPFVEAVRAFRGNTLLLLATAAIAALVERNFGSQQLMRDGEQLPGRRKPGQTETEHRIFLCARIDRALFGVPIEHVLEVIEGQEVTPLFMVPTMLRGLINLRGQVLACIDLSGELGFAPRLLEERNQFLALHGDGAELALCVDKVTGIRRLSPELVRKADMVLTGDITRYATGVIEEPDGVLFVLSVAAIFDTPALQPYRSQ